MLRYAGFEEGVAGLGGIAGFDDQKEVIGSSGLRGGKAGDGDEGCCCGRAGSEGGGVVEEEAVDGAGERSSCCSCKISLGILLSVFRNAAPDATAMTFQQERLTLVHFLGIRTKSIAFGSPFAIVAYFAISLFV